MEAERLVPEFERWERIDGVIFDMSPIPISDHQSAVSRLQGEFYSYLKGKTCWFFVAPFAVYLDETEQGNYVEPDITIICDPSKIQRKGCKGVPDMVVEVLSPSTAEKDKRTKLKRYRMSGVREYWIVDPINQYLEVYKLSKNVFTEPQVYGSDESVMVGIFDDLEMNLCDIFS